MEKLSDEHLHLLLDEPIYVMPDHGDHPIVEDQAEEYISPSFEGNNEKGICVFIGNNPDSLEQDMEFLFKGLNALDITHSDIALYKDNCDLTANYPAHTRRIEFITSVAYDSAFSINKETDISILQAKSIAEIRNDLELKKKFWLSLKELFGKA